MRQLTVSARGVSGCGIDPMAPPGTTFVVDFWVWDGAKANATTSRYITITDPCPSNDTATYDFCRSPADGRCGSGQGFRSVPLNVAFVGLCTTCTT